MGSVGCFVHLVDLGSDGAGEKGAFYTWSVHLVLDAGVDSAFGY